MDTRIEDQGGLDTVLRRFQYRRYDLDFQFEGAGHPTGWVPNLFRGAFGANLRRITCFCSGGKDQDRSHRKGCVYSEMFESPVPVSGASSARLTTHAPHPFAMFVGPVSEEGRGRAEVVLFGSALRYFPYVLMTFVQMGRRGIARQRSVFNLLEVTSEGKPVYNPQSEEILEYRRPANFEPSGATPARIGIQLLSPLWLVQNGHQVKRFSPLPFFNSLMRRIEILLACYCGMEAGWDKVALLNRLGRSVQVASNNTRWVSCERYSQRQKAEMDVGGLVGEIVLTGQLTEALMLLELGAITHNGKKSSFGNGKYRLFS